MSDDGPIIIDDPWVPPATDEERAKVREWWATVKARMEEPDHE